LMNQLQGHVAVAEMVIEKAKRVGGSIKKTLLFYLIQ